MTTASPAVVPEFEDRPLFTPFRVIVVLILLGMALWMVSYPADWQTWLGFSKWDYFVAGQNYAFTSGPGPMIETGIGLSTIIAGLWHHLNCHTAGCPWIVRHKIAGGEYGVCSHHWRQINGNTADHKFTIEHLRDRHRAHLEATGRAA